MLKKKNYKRAAVLLSISMMVGLVSACGGAKDENKSAGQAALLATGATMSQFSMSGPSNNYYSNQASNLSFTIVANDMQMQGFRVINIRNNNIAVADQVISQNSPAYPYVVAFFRGQIPLQQNSYYGNQSQITITIVDSSNVTRSYPAVDQYSLSLFQFIQQLTTQQNPYCQPGYYC